MILRISLTAVLLILSSTSYAQSQKPDFRFKTAELQTISRDLAGNERFWPLISKLAVYEAQVNEFVLKPESLKWLSEFKKVADKNEIDRPTFAFLIKNGARVFAPDELNSYNEAWDSYLAAIKSGNTKEALTKGELTDQRLLILKNATEKNRKEAVEAILAEKTGEVYKRINLLGKWNSTDKGALFEESNGIKTDVKSYAKLDFVDGSFVMINPETIAIVQSSKIDKLSNKAEMEIQLTDGGLLASLSAKARQSTNMTLKAADSESQINSSKFWAEKGKKEKVSFSNYDGAVLVKAANQEVQLEKNEGTIIEKGKAPSSPVKLLPAPKLTWPAQDSLSYDPVIFLTWNKLDDAVSYEVEVSPTPGFTFGIKRFETKDNKVKIEPIAEGTHYIRVRAYDKLGLRGLDSPNYRLLKNRDDQPPAIFFKNGMNQDYFTRESTFLLEGITEPGSAMTVNNQSISVQASGEFSFQSSLEKSVNQLEIVAEDRSQNKTKVSKRIIKMMDEQLWRLNWSTAVNGDVITRKQLIQVSGKAYEPLLVEAEFADKKFKVECGQNWDWALQLQIADADLLKIRFIMKKSGEVVSEKQFKIR